MIITEMDSSSDKSRAAGFLSIISREIRCFSYRAIRSSGVISSTRIREKAVAPLAAASFTSSISFSAWVLCSRLPKDNPFTLRASRMRVETATSDCCPLAWNHFICPLPLPAVGWL